MLTYLSNTSLNLFYSRPQDFYVQYILGEKTARFGGAAMDIGSVFDSLVKNAIAEEMGLAPMTMESSFPSDTMELGMKCFDDYQLGYKELVKELRAGENVQLDLDLTLMVEGVPIRGKPDLQYIRDGKLVILDWKTSGWASTTVRKAPGSWIWRNGQYSGDTCRHGNFVISPERLKSDWAQQLMTYVLLCQGSCDEAIVGIEYLTPQEVTKYRTITLKNELTKIIEKYKTAWTMICAGHYFWGTTLEENAVQIEKYSNPEFRILFR